MTQKLFNTSNSRLGLLIIIYAIYIFFGASIFDALESPHEFRIITDLNNYVRAFREQHTCLTSEELNKFIQDISSASNKGISPLKNVTGDQKWTFGQSVFFSGTVLSTIGYGNVSPLTKGGKLFCMLFAIIGIPITLILLTAIIERLMIHTRRFLNYTTDKLQPCFSRLCGLAISIAEIRISFAFVCVLFVLVFLILIPAAIYSSIEHWSYLNAFYYCFISISTVGLGDYVPGDQAVQDHRHLYKICSTAYLALGVLFMVWLLEVFSEIPEFNLYQYFTLSKDGQLTHHPASARSQNYIQTISSGTSGNIISNDNNETIGIDLRTATGVTLPINRATYESTLQQDPIQNEANIQ